MRVRVCVRYCSVVLVQLMWFGARYSNWLALLPEVLSINSSATFARNETAHSLERFVCCCVLVVALPCLPALLACLLACLLCGSGGGGGSGVMATCDNREWRACKQRAECVRVRH